MQQQQDTSTAPTSLLPACILIGCAIAVGVLVVLNPGGEIHKFETNRQYKKAIDLCNQSLKFPLYAYDPTIYFERGFSKRNLGDYKGAILDQQEALRLRKQNWLMWGFKGFGIPHYLDHSFYLELGRNYLSENDLPKAQEYFDRALKIEKSMDAYQALALLHEKNNDYAKAESAFTSAIEAASSSESEIVLHNRALFYWRNNKTDQAIKDLKDALALSSCAEANTDLGYILIERHDYKNAIVQFNTAIESSQFERAYHGRAIAEMEENSLLQSAEKDLDKAIQLDPTCMQAIKDKQIVHEKIQAAQKQ